MKAFYHLDSTRITVKEYMFGSPIYLPIILFIKLFRIPVTSSTDDPAIESVTPFEVGEDAMPPEVLARFQQTAEELAALGFHSPVYHVIADTLRSTQYYWATYLHNSGGHVARIHLRVWTGAAKVRIRQFPIFSTPCTNNTIIVSSAGKADLLTPASVITDYHFNASTQQLWASHQRVLNQHGVTPSAVRSQDVLRRLIEEWHRRLRDFHLARGVFKPLKDVEKRQLKIVTELPEYGNVPRQDAEVYAQLVGLQEKRENSGQMLPLLLVSLILFIAAGKSYRFTGLMMIIPILAFHELGHYMTMRAMKYKNLSVFFIPFLGAAVTGQNYNVPGWKKSLVALTGPVPGIILGIVLGIVAAALAMKTLMFFSLMLLIVNALNLLPILPLDGGWVFHAVLFSRHPYLDTAFRALAVVGLFLLGMGLHDHILRAVCIPMAMAIPTSWRQANIAYRLRQRGVSGNSPDNHTVPLDTAGAILQEVRQTQPKLTAPMLQAQQVLSIFGTLNARPPGGLASVGILAVQFGAFITAIVAILFLAVAFRHLAF